MSMDNIDDDLPEKFDAYLDTNSEDSDSEMSGKEVDSDIENEKEISYDRKFYKDDLVTLKPVLKEEIKKACTFRVLKYIIQDLQ